MPDRQVIRLEASQANNQPVKVLGTVGCHVTLLEAKNESNCAGIGCSSPALGVRGPALHTSSVFSPLTQDLPDQLEID
jgi:hypothetical protein